ncbi:MAG: capsule biosynthesis protein [Pseudomonadota bacterium]
MAVPAPPQQAAGASQPDADADRIRAKVQAARANKQAVQGANPASAQAGPKKGQAAGATNIDAIRNEGLTGRQLRLARRVAQKNGINATSDYEAVKLLRERGIDPFKASGALQLVPQEQTGTALAPAQTTQVAQPAPAGGSEAEMRAAAILQMQRDIARRRRNNMFRVFGRLGVFVFLPTALLGIYFAFLATPMYGTKSSFIIQTNEPSAGGGGGGLGGMFSGGALATIQDSIAVQGYLTSRDAMLRLEEEQGFKRHFQDPELDIITRLPPDASNEDAYKLYKKHVKIGFDPTEGIVNLEVIAASPEASQRFSNTLVAYAEQWVSDLSQRLRTDQMRGARESFEDAENKRLAAANRLVTLQTELGEIDAESSIAAAQGRISNFETELEEKRIELQAQLANRRPNEARVDGLETDIFFLQQSIDAQKTRLLEAEDGGASLASIQAQIQIAQIDLQTRDTMLQSAVEALESARVSADRQARYVAISTPPTAPDTATYPRVFENTFVSFLVFAGIYLMISLTSSILREQVAS